MTLVILLVMSLAISARSEKGDGREVDLIPPWDTPYARQMMALCEKRVISLTTNTPLEELRAIIQTPFPEEIELSDIYDDPARQLSIVEVYDHYGFRLLTEEDYRFPAKGKNMSAEVWIEHLRRATAAWVLLQRKDDSVMKWFVARRNSSRPTLLEALIMEGGYLPEGMGFLHDEWILLFEARNPICRMMAVKHIVRWAQKREIVELLEKALYDEYKRTRWTALATIGDLKPPRGQGVLQKFLKRRIPIRQRQDEEWLNDESRRILDKLSALQGSTTNTPP